VAPQAWRGVRGAPAFFVETCASCTASSFEEEFFRARGVNAHYIVIRCRDGAASAPGGVSGEASASSRAAAGDAVSGEPRGRIGAPSGAVAGAVERIGARREATFLLAVRLGAGAIRRRFYAPLTGGGQVRIVEGETRDTMAYADVTLRRAGRW